METELERLRKKVENFPSPSTFLRIAELLRVEKNDAEAERYLRRCMKEFPRNAQSYVIFAEILAGQGKRPDALQMLRQAIERDPRSLPAYRLMAEQLHASGDTPAAIAALHKALAVKADDPACKQLLAELERKPGPPAPPGSSSASARPAVAQPVRAPASNVLPQGGPAPTAQPAPVQAPAASPAAPPVGALTQALRAATGGAPATARTATLDPVAAEAGVRGAVVADANGRVVMARKLAAGQDEILAAYGAEMAKAVQAAVSAVGGSQVAIWTVAAGQGQVLAFQRSPAFAVIAVAESGVRPAMLELRARQALLDLGAA